MKRKIALLVIAVVSLTLLMSLFSCEKKTEYGDGGYIRIHVRANSDSEYDQQTKLMVKDEIVLYISSLAKGVETRDRMYSLLSENLQSIKRLVDQKLESENVDYRAYVYLKNELFPKKQYDNLVLPSGYYDALIVELGSGTGSNWWCVAFPPLCFLGGEKTGNDEIVYKSIFAELFER